MWSAFTGTSQTDLGDVILQPSKRGLGLSYLRSEGVIILSSNGIELGCSSIIHAGGFGGTGHSGGTLGADEQALSAGSNTSSEALILSLGVSQVSRVLLIDLGRIRKQLPLEIERIAQTVGPGCHRIQPLG